MTQQELNKVIEEHNIWLNSFCMKGTSANLRGANLRGANLRGANLTDANLIDADLTGANLRGADLTGANLRGANLIDADLTGANLRGADLRGANLTGANLTDANLRGANLRGANLRGANLDFSCLPLWCGSLLANMDDRQVKQLLYHTLSIVKHSNNVSELLKEQLLTETNLKIAKEFHRADECQKL